MLRLAIENIFEAHLRHKSFQGTKDKKKRICDNGMGMVKVAVAQKKKKNFTRKLT